MEIVGDDTDRPGPQEVAYQAKERPVQRFTIDPRALAGSELGQECQKLGRDTTQPSLLGREAGQLAEHRGERFVRSMRVGGPAAAEQGEQVTAAGPFANESRLPEAGRASDEDRASPSLGKLGRRASERRELRAAPDEQPGRRLSHERGLLGRSRIRPPLHGKEVDRLAHAL